jgi:hypothetical protein
LAGLPRQVPERLQPLARRAAKRQQVDDAFDFSDLDEPVIVTEEVVVVTEAGPYEIDMELVSVDDAGSR